MFIGYLLTAETLSPKDQSLLDSTVKSLEKHYVSRHLHSSTFSLTAFGHVQLPMERRLLHYHSVDEQCTLLIIGKVYYTYAKKEIHDASPETIVTLYSKLGPAFFDQLSGEFVCLLIDEKKSCSYLATDHIGSIPCYYRQREGAVFFASHAPTLSIFCEGEDLQPAYIEKQFYAYAPGYAIPPFQSMKKVLPGHYVQIDQKGYASQAYWQPEKRTEQKALGFQEATHRLKENLQWALETRMDKAYTPGTHLSGGLDSALLTDWCRDLHRDQIPFMSYSWSPSEKIRPLQKPDDERTLIQSFAARRDIHVQFTDLRTQDYLTWLDDGSFPMDFPFERLVQETASAQGVNLLVSAWGADEFAGIDNHAVRLYLFRRGRWRAFFGRNSAKGFKNHILYLLNEGLFPKRRKPYAKWKTSAPLRRFLKVGHSLRMPDAGLYRSPRRMMLGTLRYHHLADRCEYWYNRGQLHGVQYTYPFLDKRVMESCLQFPEDVFVKGNDEKPLIRALVAELPDGETLLGQQLEDPVLYTHFNHLKAEACEILLARVDEYAQTRGLEIFDHAAFRHWLSELNLKEESARQEVEYILSYLSAARAAIQSFAAPHHPEN